MKYSSLEVSLDESELLKIEQNKPCCIKLYLKICNFPKKICDCFCAYIGTVLLWTLVPFNIILVCGLFFFLMFKLFSSNCMNCY